VYWADRPWLKEYLWDGVKGGRQYGTLLFVMKSARTSEGHRTILDKHDVDSIRRLLPLIGPYVDLEPLRPGRRLGQAKVWERIFSQEVKPAGWQAAFSAHNGDLGPPDTGRESSGCGFLLLAQFVSPAKDAGPSSHHVQEAVGVFCSSAGAVRDPS